MWARAGLQLCKQILQNASWPPPLHLSCTVCFGFTPVLGLFIPSSLFSLFFGFSGFMPQTMGAPSKPNPRAPSTLNSKKMLPCFCRPQANRRGLCQDQAFASPATCPLPLFIIIFFSSKCPLSRYLLARPSPKHFRHIIAFTQQTHHVEWMSRSLTHYDHSPTEKQRIQLQRDKAVCSSSPI